MDFRDVLSARLPAPRDDEPGRLRQDILDELADHLACAYRRELLRGAGPAEARRRVLEGFGDPAAVARRLWFDAMKGRFMSQRILVVCCVMMTAVSLGLAGLMWVHSERSRHMAMKEMAESQRLRFEMQEQLRAARATEPSKSNE